MYIIILYALGNDFLLLLTYQASYIMQKLKPGCTTYDKVDTIGRFLIVNIY